MSLQNILSNIKAPIVYERLWDNRPKRTIQDHITILTDLNVDMIFRSNFRWAPVPFDSCEGLTSDECTLSGYSIDQQAEITNQIKAAIPNIILIGAIPPQKINTDSEYNEITWEAYDSTQTWNMALDPSKWGISVPTKTDFQNEMTNGYSIGGWYPDITIPDVQSLILSWAQNQINTGVDAIWLDGLFDQAYRFYGLTNNINHQSVLDSFNAAVTLLKSIKALGKPVGTWVAPMALFYQQYNIIEPVDFVTATPLPEEILNQTMNDTAWNDAINLSKTVFGDIPFFANIDWGSDTSPMAAFSQQLSSIQQNSFLTIASQFFKNKGIKFVYPVHGGSLGLTTANILSFGQWNWYDSLAPEFNTYSTIKQLINPTPTPTPTPIQQAGFGTIEMVIIGGLVLGAAYIALRK